MNKAVKYYCKLQKVKHEFIKALGDEIAYKMFEQVYNDPLWKMLSKQREK